MTPIAPHVEAFLRNTLSHHRGASQHTCDSYAYSFQLLFEFAAARLKVRPSSLALEQLDSEMVSAFLEASGGHAAQRAGDAQCSVGSDQILLPLP